MDKKIIGDLKWVISGLVIAFLFYPMAISNWRSATSGKILECYTEQTVNGNVYYCDFKINNDEIVTIKHQRQLWNEHKEQIGTSVSVHPGQTPRSLAPLFLGTIGMLSMVVGVISIIQRKLKVKDIYQI